MLMFKTPWGFALLAAVAGGDVGRGAVLNNRPGLAGVEIPHAIPLIRHHTIGIQHIPPSGFRLGIGIKSVVSRLAEMHSRQDRRRRGLGRRCQRLAAPQGKGTGRQDEEQP